MKLVHISAYYKADQPQGVNGQLTSPDGSDLTAVLHDLRTSWDQLWREAVNRQAADHLVTALEQQLVEIGSQRHQGVSSESDLLIAIANVDLLERVGRLKSDEFNGVMLIYGDKSRAVVVSHSGRGGTETAQEGVTGQGSEACWLKFNVEAVCHAVADEIDTAGWDVERQGLEGFPAGPVIYVCDYEAQSIVMLQLALGAVEALQSRAQEVSATFQDAVGVLGSLMDELASGERTLTDRCRRDLVNCATLYLLGTRTYALAQAHHIEQFLVIRYQDARLSGRILRPWALDCPGPASPDVVAEEVLRILALDRLRHPERFSEGQVLRFRGKSPP